MKITASAVSLNVDDVPASVRFLTTHFGFTEEMSADGFASLARPDVGLNVVFLRRGLGVLPEDQRHDHSRGLILAFQVDDLEGELAVPVHDLGFGRNVRPAMQDVPDRIVRAFLAATTS